MADRAYPGLADAVVSRATQAARDSDWLTILNADLADATQRANAGDQRAASDVAALRNEIARAGGAKVPAAQPNPADYFGAPIKPAKAGAKALPNPADYFGPEVDDVPTPEKPGMLARIGAGLQDALPSAPQGQRTRGGLAAETRPAPMAQDPAQRQLPAGVEPSPGNRMPVEKPDERAVYARGQKPYEDKRAAIDDAVDLIESGADRQKVYDQFSRLGVTAFEIDARGHALGGPQFTADTRQVTVRDGAMDGQISRRDPGMVETVGNTITRAGQRIGMTGDLLANEAGIMGNEAMAGRFAQRSKAMDAAAPTLENMEGQQAISAAGKESFSAVLSAMAENPGATLTMLADSALQSLPVSMGAGALGFAAGGPAGAVGGAFAGSAAQEYTASLMEAITANGRDPRNPADVLAALNDPKLMEAARKRGAIRGMTVGAFDAISAGLAGKFIGPVVKAMESGALTGGKAVRAAGTATLKETGMQAGLGGAGEAAGAVAVGEPVNRADVLMEAFAELPGAVPEAAGNIMAARKETTKRLDDFAAQHGMGDAAVKAIKQAADKVPLADLPGFMKRAVSALARRGIFRGPTDDAALAVLDTPPAQPPAQPPTETPAEPATAAPIAVTPDDRNIEGEPINRNWTAFAPESGTLGLPREQLPQIKAEHRGALVNFLNARGITHETDEVAADTLKPTQAEFSPAKVKQAAEYEGGDRSILVSADGHILDGHHQWKAKRDSGDLVKVIRLDAPIQDLLRLAHQFPSSTTAKGPRRGAQDELVNNMAGTAGQPLGAGADAGNQPGGSGGTVGRVPADGGQRDAAPAGAAAPGGEQGASSGAGSPANAALTLDSTLGQMADVLKPKALPGASAGQPKESTNGQGQEGGRRQEVLTPQATQEGSSQAADPTASPVKVYKSRSNAEKAKKELGNTHRMQKVKGGFILRPATDKEMAAADAAGKRLARRKEVDVENDTLLTAIAKLGGLAMKEKADTIGEGNHNAGGKHLFTKNGEAIDWMARYLHELGYVPQDDFDSDGGVRWLRDAIKAEHSGFSTFNSQQGTNWLKDAEEAYRKQYEDAEPDGPFLELTPEDLADSGYTRADPETQALTEQLVRQAQALGIDTETLIDDAARATADSTEDAFHAEAQALIRQAVTRLSAGGEGRDTGATEAGSEDRGQADGGGEEAQGLTLEAQSEADLREKADREAAALESERAKKAAEQARLKKEADAKEAKARADATVDAFQLGATADQQLSGMGDMFDAPAEPANAETTLPAAGSASTDAQPATLTDAEAFADDFKAFEGVTLEQQVMVSGTGQTVTLKMDAAKTLRDLTARLDSLRALSTCARKA